MDRQETENHFVMRAIRRNSVFKVALGAILFSALCGTAVSQGIALVDQTARTTIKNLKLAKTLKVDVAMDLTRFSVR